MSMQNVTDTKVDDHIYYILSPNKSKQVAHELAYLAYLYSWNVYLLYILVVFIWDCHQHDQIIQNNKLSLNKKIKINNKELKKVIFKY